MTEIPVPFPISILYEDNHLLVVEKPVNMPSQEDESRDPDLLSLLKADLKVRYQKPGNVYLGLVHRLDRPVGGVMVFAKTSKAASRLSEMIRRRSFDKVYTAILRGTPPQAAGILVHYLLKDSRTNTVSVVEDPTSAADSSGAAGPECPDFSTETDPIAIASTAPTHPHRSGAKKAVLDYQVQSVRDDLSLVRIQLHTGRPHQIRVQFAATGCPLYGDQKYGATMNKPGQQLALWATELSFEHPVTKETMRFHSPTPLTDPWTMFH